MAYARPAPAGQPRVGVAVSRQLRGAVTRNRVRRRLREAARLELLGRDLEKAELGITYDVVLIARPPALEAPFVCLTREVAAVRKRLRP